MKKVYFSLVVILWGGCATATPELTAWNMAREVNTPAAYQDFLRRYPNSSNADEARALIDKARTEQIKQVKSVDECVRIAKAGADPKSAALLADVAFEAAKKETSIDALYSFLATFKGHAGTPEVRKRLERLEFEGASRDSSAIPMEFFLYRYPDSPLAAEGKRLLAEKTYAQVKRWGNQYGYKAFLARFPDSPRAAEIRSLLRPAIVRPAAAGSEMTLAEAVKKSPSLKRLGCALVLSAAIRNNAGDADALRFDLYRMEKEDPLASLPQMCASVVLAGKRGAEEELAEALRALAAVEEQRKGLAEKWEVYRQREEVVKAAIVASSNTANDLETAELSEEVLGTGPLGRLEIGAEKGSVSARKALERFKGAQNVIQRDKEEIKRLLFDVEGLYRPLQAYVFAVVEAK